MKKIMIADSIRDNCEKLERGLSAHGFSSYTVTKGFDVAMFDHEQTMLVLISQTMQDMSAFEVLNLTKQQNPYFNEVPFIICTSDNSDEFTRHCLNAGFRGVLYRPFNRNALFKLIRNVMIDSGLANKEMFMGEEQVEAINDKERLEFLRYLLKQPSPIIVPKYEPKVNTGYYYPILAEYFAMDQGEEYDLLRSYTALNIFNQHLENRVNLCPQCSFHTINLRKTCPHCASLDIHFEEVLHHLSCNHIGSSADFDSGMPGKLFCPKCNHQLYTIGLDYEKPADTYVCHSCEHVFNEPQTGFNCFHCGYIGNANEIVMTNIYSYAPGVKAARIIAHGSFELFRLEELLTMDDYQCNNVDFFRYMLQRNFKEMKDYRDRLTVMVIAIRDVDTACLKALLNFIQENKRAAEMVTIDSSRNLLMTIPRESQKSLMKRAKAILEFVRTVDHQPPYSACVFLRRLDNDDTLCTNDLFKRIMTDFEMNCSERPEKIVTYNQASS